MKTKPKLRLAGTLLAASLAAGNAGAAVIGLGINATDFGAPSSFSFSVSTALTPTIFGLADWSVFLEGSCTDGGSDGCGISPFSTPGAIADFSVNGGTSVATLGSSQNIASPGGTFTFLPATLSGVFDCGIAGCTSFEILMSFTGTGGSDVTSLSSRFEFAAATVPEPDSLALALLGLGLAALAVVRRRQR